MKLITITGPVGSGTLLYAKRLSETCLKPSPDVCDVYVGAGLCQKARGACECVCCAQLAPFRSPHHTISEAGLIGGARYRTVPANEKRVFPGEVSLASGGVLLLDQVAEFRLSALQALGRVLKAGKISLAARDIECEFVAAPTYVVASAYDCPCGRGSTTDLCSCSKDQIAAHRNKITRAINALEGRD